jgi:hypothetical protein
MDFCHGLSVLRCPVLVEALRQAVTPPPQAKVSYKMTKKVGKAGRKFSSKANAYRSYIAYVVIVATVVVVLMITDVQVTYGHCICVKRAKTLVMGVGIVEPLNE